LGSTHQRVRRLRRLIQKRSLRWSEGVCVLEGPDLIEAALESGAQFEAIYVDASQSDVPRLAALTSRASDLGVRVFALDNGVLEKVADAQTPQPVLAAVRFDEKDVTSVPGEGLVLVVHELRDPGNAGTIIRSADAAGATAVIFTGTSVDPYNPKTLRATAGSIFHLDVCVATLEATLTHFTSLGAQTLATVVRGGVSHREVDFTRATVVVIGNEADGLDADAVAQCDGAVTIPMAGRSESLNAGVAASLIAFEALWQRSSATPSPPTPSL
jgi:TrmH family RNA methyltransferase